MCFFVEEFEPRCPIMHLLHVGILSDLVSYLFISHAKTILLKINKAKVNHIKVLQAKYQSTTVSVNSELVILTLTQRMQADAS